MELGVGKFPQPSIEDEVGIKVALTEPASKSAKEKMSVTILICPHCKQPVEIRTKLIDGNPAEEIYYCNKCHKKDIIPETIEEIKEVPLELGEQFTRDSTTGFYDEVDALDVSVLDSLLNTLQYITCNHRLNLKPAHTYFLTEKTKVSSVSKSTEGRLTKAILTHRVETTEKVEQKIEDKINENQRKDFFGNPR